MYQRNPKNLKFQRNPKNLKFQPTQNYLMSLNYR
jgi:hypothetical protein